MKIPIPFIISFLYESVWNILQVMKKCAVPDMLIVIIDSHWQLKTYARYIFISHVYMYVRICMHHQIYKVGGDDPQQ